MPEPKGNDVQRTLAVRVSPDYHAQLSVVAQVDEVTLVDLMMTALDQYVARRRESEDFRAKGPAGSGGRRSSCKRHEPCCSARCLLGQTRAKQVLTHRPPVGVDARTRLPPEGEVSKT